MLFRCADYTFTKNQQKSKVQILDYLIKIGATRTVYEHAFYGKCDAIWLCARYGAPFELKKLLEHSREGLDCLYGEDDTNAMAQAFLHEKPEYIVTNVKLLLEYGADPNAFLHVGQPFKNTVTPFYKGLTPLHLVISNFLVGEASLEDTEILMLALLRSEGINVKV